MRARWPKRHEHVVEACPVITVGTVLADVPPDARGWGRWGHPRYPAVEFLTRREGAVVRTWFVCPACGCPRGALYQPPDSPRAPWVCRECVGGNGAMYASERFGRRHPLRAVLTPRKLASQARRAARAQRRAGHLLPTVRAQLGLDAAGADIQDRVASVVASTLAIEPGGDARRLVAGARDVLTRMATILGRSG